MKATILYPLLALTGGMLSSCVYYANPVPEMPYRPSRHATPPAPQPPSPESAPPPSEALPETPWATALPGARPVSPEPAASAPKEAPAPKPEPKAAPKPEPKAAHEPPAPAPTHITPSLPKPAAAATPATGVQASPPPPLQPLPEPKSPALQEPQNLPPAPKQPTDKKLITNDGPIPYATKVEGDPTRVYNPLDPNKTIRIIDKNGNVYPSGKELKVKGTNYHFYVP